MKNNKLKNPAYEDQFIDWLLSDYKDETQLLKPQELQNRLAAIDHKILIHEENLFLIQSLLKVYKKIFKIDDQNEQRIAIIMLNFVEKAQKEQLRKIHNAHETVGRILLLAQGKLMVINTILRTILSSDTLISSNYLDNLTLWLASEEQDRSQLLIGRELELALMESPPKLTQVENKFLVRSLVFNLRSS